jgi:SAM-dependent methyltransferase
MIATADSFAGLICPKDGNPLDKQLQCRDGHRYPLVDGVPILLRDDLPPTISVATASLAASRDPASDAPLYLDSVGVSPEQRRLALRLFQENSPIDPVAAVLVAATSGYAYGHLVGKLDRYPIPEIPLPESDGKRLLDIGCSWGRWAMSAAAKGYRVTGIDPSLGAVLAAKRASRQLGLDIRFICADARALPLAQASFDQVFSYSVIQHLSVSDAEAALDEMARVLKPGGQVLVQMAHKIGLRSLYHQARRRFREPNGFEVRYWSASDLRHAFARRFTGAGLRAHCYFGLGLELSDTAMMKPHMRTLIRLSESLRRMSDRIPALALAADSVYMSGTRG